MRTTLLLAGALIALSGCDRPATSVLKDGGFNYTILVIDGCQYFLWSASLCHKGNCTNIIHAGPKSEWGPDGYGFRHLAKAESELVREATFKMGGPWFHGTLFENLSVIKTVTHEQMTVSEIMEILNRQPNVAGVSLGITEKIPFFSLSTLAYPQYKHEYQLTKDQWKSLQVYCRIQLIDPIAAKEVIAHWQSITSGIPPFGIRVQP